MYCFCSSWYCSLLSMFCSRSIWFCWLSSWIWLSRWWFSSSKFPLRRESSWNTDQQWFRRHVTPWCYTANSAPQRIGTLSRGVRLGTVCTSVDLGWINKPARLHSLELTARPTWQLRAVESTDQTLGLYEARCTSDAENLAWKEGPEDYMWNGITG